LQAIISLPIPREKRKMNKKAKTKTARAALAGKGMCCWHCRSYRLIIERCTCRVEGGAAMQCTMEFSRAISPQAGGERAAASLLARKLLVMSF